MSEPHREVLWKRTFPDALTTLVSANEIDCETSPSTSVR
jgi:hypothetical protein